MHIHKFATMTLHAYNVGAVRATTMHDCPSDKGQTNENTHGKTDNLGLVGGIYPETQHNAPTSTATNNHSCVPGHHPHQTAVNCGKPH